MVSYVNQSIFNESYIMFLDVVMHSCFQGHYYIMCVGRWQTLLPVRIKSGKAEIENFYNSFYYLYNESIQWANSILLGWAFCKTLTRRFWS